MSKTIAIIQARIGSARLYAKVLADIAGKPMLARVIERVQRAKTIDSIVVATTDRAEDQAICNLAIDMGVSCYAGSVDDVLDRYYQAAMLAEADVIVRITGDCPMVDSEMIDLCVNVLIQDTHHYVSNTLPPESWPDGMDVEAFTIQALKGTWQNAVLASDREHVTPGMRRELPRKYVGALVHVPDLSHHRWCVDEQADLDFVRAVYTELGRDDFGMADVLALLERRPELVKINGHLKRNSAYLSQVEGERHGLLGVSS